MGSRFHPPVTTDHHGSPHAGLMQDIGQPYSSSFDEDTDEEIFDRPMHQYDAFSGEPPLQVRPAVAAEAGPCRVNYYASPNLGEISTRINYNVASSPSNTAAREVAVPHMTPSSNTPRLAETPARVRGPSSPTFFGERKGENDDHPVKSRLEEVRPNVDVYSSHGRETHDSTGPSFVAVDMGGKKKPRRVEHQIRSSDGAVNAVLGDYIGRNKQNWPKAYGENRPDAKHVAEEAFSKVKFWREVFSGLTGMHGVYVLANFAFDNPAGGICSLFCFLCSAFAQVDRRAPSYFLTALLSFCFGVVVAVSLGTPVRGFEIFSTNLLLRRICITQACLLLLATPVAILVALRIIELHSFLREPGVLVPVDCIEQITEDVPKNAQDSYSNSSEQRTNNDLHTRRDVTECGSQDDENSSYVGNQAAN
ncbi:hypothetical protein, conserved [Eimeria maxima]|uniref:Transmembrane protein n=1 Tax=Eimeria maxima TaxID=5804 RepID=U6M7Q8_EIMMA|nr:hypothetical protein, conserved [Eimeria maxima]CDJ59088.1 hypothetical protein, conserved [Eimeria maxima]